MTSVAYQISLDEANAHLFNITCEIPAIKNNRLVISLPTWIPGSYLVRDFAKNIVQIKAFAKDRELELQRIDKDSWLIKPNKKRITIYYQVYAADTSVRAAYLDNIRGFFNGTSLFLKVDHLESMQHTVNIKRPLSLPKNNWRVATSMTPLRTNSDGFGYYKSDCYQDLIDHPFEIGVFQQSNFVASGITHEVVVTGHSQANIERICSDLKKIVETQIKFWKESPIDRYVFLINAVASGYGGLEHSHSTALICSRKSLPLATDDHEINDDYLEFLGLCSHEYFHLWNVKRIKPEAFSPPNLSKENYTELLWAFEGITSYYDDLMLMRAGLITPARYLKLIEKNITRVQKGEGRKKQTLAESSFYAWTKFYKQDENAPNAISSYYTKGSLAALCLDLQIRDLTQHRKSLDEIMRELWKIYGRTNIGVPEGGVEATAINVTGIDLHAFFNEVIRSTKELPLKRLLRSVNLKLNFITSGDHNHEVGTLDGSSSKRGDGRRYDLEASYTVKNNEVVVKQIFEGGAAQQAGISSGDIITSINRQKVSIENIHFLLDTSETPTKTEIHLFRDEKLYKFDVHLLPPKKNIARVLILEDEKNLRKKWLQ